MILLAGVTYFFGIAQVNGTIDRLIDAGLDRAGSRPLALPYVFIVLSGAVAAMGSPQAGLVLAPVGMPVARRSGVDPLVMAIAINAGISAGGLAPTSLFGIVSYRVAREAGIAISPLTLFGEAVAANLVLLTAAVLIFRLRTTATVATPAAVGGACRSGDSNGSTSSRLSAWLGLVATRRRIGAARCRARHRRAGPRIWRAACAHRSIDGNQGARSHRLVHRLPRRRHRHLCRRPAEARRGRTCSATPP